MPGNGPMGSQMAGGPMSGPQMSGCGPMGGPQMPGGGGPMPGNQPIGGGQMMQGGGGGPMGAGQVGSQGRSSQVPVMNSQMQVGQSYPNYSQNQF